MTWNSIRGWLGTLVRLALGVVWIWASVEKLRSPRTFVQAVRAYDATPEWLSKAIGYGLPVLEFCLGVLLVLGIAVRVAAAVSAVLFVVFLIGIIQAAARGLQLSCGCFGGGGQTANTTYTLDILRDIGLLILAAYLVMFAMTRISVEEFLARHDHVPEPSAKRLRSQGGARKYNAMVEARRKQARDRALYLNGSLAIVVILVSVVGIGVQAGRAKIEGSLTATNASVPNGVVYGKKAAATVDIYEDFQCPVCEQFEQDVHANLDKDVTANLAQVRFHPISILDSSSSGNRYSSRAANAALCASDVGVDFFVKYHNYLYGKDKQGKQIQPAEGDNGRTNDELISYATAAGLPTANASDFAACVNTEQHKALVQAMTDGASKKGINATPTVLVNGKTLKDHTWASLSAAITAADKGFTPSPSPSTSPSAAGSPSGAAPGAPSGSGSASASGSASGSPTG